MTHKILTAKQLENMKLSDIKEFVKKPHRMYLFENDMEMEAHREEDLLTEAQHHFGWGED